MKRLFVFALFLIIAAKVDAQSCHDSYDTICTPSDTLTQTEFVPNYDALPCAVDGIHYSQIIDVHSPTSTTYDGLSVTIQSIIIKSITNLPCGMCWATNNPDDSMGGGKTLCIRVSGTTYDAPGQYLLNVVVFAHVLVEGVISDTATENLSALGLQYYIRVAQTDSACALVDTNSAGNTATTAGSIAAPSITGKTTFCPGSNDTLTATGGSYYAYHWSNDAITSSIVVTAGGKYSVTVYDNCNSDSASITVGTYTVTTPTITANGDTTFCQGDSVVLTSSSGSSYSWSGGATTQNITAKQTDNYMVTVTNANGCTAASSPAIVTVNSNPTPDINANGPTTFCQGDSVTLTATSESSYSWSTSATTQSIVVKTTGGYTVTVTNGNGCTGASAPTSVTVNLPAATAISAGICAGTSYNFNGRILTTANTYTDTLTAIDGCDSVITLTLTVKPVSSSTINASICAGSSYDFNGRILTTANTYFDTLTAANGCDSIVTLNLTVKPVSSSTIDAAICAGSSYDFNGRTLTTANTYYDTLTAANGCDSIVTLNLTVNQPTLSTINASICAGTSYNFNGRILTTANTYTDTLTGSNSCDSIVTLNLTVTPLSSSSYSASICAGDSYNFNGRILTAANTYTDTLTGTNGCDSIVTLTLTVNQPSATSIQAGICAGSSYNFNGRILTTANTYFDTLTAADGCDSIITLVLTVNQPSFTSIAATICVGDSFDFNGVEEDTAGIYVDTLTNSNGCDSIITLTLQTGAYATRNFNAAICQGTSYSFYGQQLDSTGSYSDTITNTGGCDSIVTVDLTVNPPTFDTINAAICQGESYSFDGSQLTSAGIYYDTLTNANGCDSFVTLILVVNQPTFSSIDTSFCAGTGFNFNGKVYTTEGTFTDTLSNANGCDSIVTLTLAINQPSFDTISATICAGNSYSFNGQGLTVAGSYNEILTSANGCDSTVTLNLMVTLPITTSYGASICAGSGYFFNGQTLTTPGLHSDTLVNGNGCDSIVTVDLTLIPPSVSNINAAICANSSYNFNGQTLTVAGTYYDTIAGGASNGCDSIVTLSLSVNQLSLTNLQASICAGSGYDFNGVRYYIAGTYMDTFTGSNNCDSIVSLTLTILQPVLNNMSASICAGSSYNFNGRILTRQNTYTDTLTAANGCDSIIVLALTVVQPVFDTVNQTICTGSSYDFNGILYTATGTYTDTFIASSGCDSIVTLNLTVSSIISYSYNMSICKGSRYLFDDSNLTVAGSYSDTLVTLSGCDSVVTVNLTVIYPSFDTINAHICAGTSYILDSIPYSIAGQYTDTIVPAVGCDSIVTLNLTIDSLPVVVWKTYDDTICIFDTLTLNGGSPAGGTYSGPGVTGNLFIPANAHGLSPVLTYSYTDSIGCTDTANQVFVVDPCEGINSVSTESSITLYPNPANDMLIVQSDLFTNKMTPEIFDVTGRMIAVTFVQENNKIVINTSNLAMGTYCVRLNINGLLVSKRFVKTE